MSTWRPIQEAFTAGEISPYFYAQQESDLYRMGLKKCRNMVPLTQGAVTSRPGTQFLGKLEDIQFPVTNGRCIPIEINSETWAVAVMGGGGLSVLTGGTFTTDRQKVLNPDMDLGLSFWDTEVESSSGDAHIREVFYETTNTIQMDCRLAVPIGRGGRAWVRQTVLVDEVGLEDLAINFAIQWHRDPAVTTAVMDARVRIGTSGVGSSDILDQVYSNERGDTERVSFTWPGSAGFTGNVYIELHISSVDGGGQWPNIHLQQFNIWVKGIVGDTAPIVNTPYADEDLDDIQFISSPFTLQTVFVHPDYAPHELIVEGAVWTFQEIVFMDDPGPDDPDWGGGNGFPRACGAFQGRLVFAGSPGEPQSVWATAPGNWYDIALDAAPTAIDAVWFTLAVRGAIRWVHGQKALLVGASNAEHEVGSTSQILQAGNVSAKVQSGYGSTGIQAVEVAQEVLYVGGDEKTIRGMNFSRDMQGQESINKSWASEHITEPGVRRVANARDPYQVVWMPMKDGSMAAMSYEPTYNLIGWHVHATDGDYIDVCNAKVETFDYTFFIVKRNIQGVDVFYLEAVREIQRGSDIRFSDSYVDAHLGDPQGTLDGLDHLEGKTVAVLADGEVQSSKVVVGGSIVLDPPASSVTAGLAYTAEIETLPAIAPSNVGGLASRKSWAEIGVRLLNSPPPIVNGIRQEPGDDPSMVNLGWDLYATITVEQDQPLPLTVTGIYGRLSTEDIIG